MTERNGVYRAGSSEHQQQSAVVAWARSRETMHPELALLFAVPNAGKRSVRLAAYMRAEGLKAGVPDLWLPVARRGYHGLVIEMKWGDNTTTPEQEQWLFGLNCQDYLAVVCRSAGEAIELIEWYIDDHDMPRQSEVTRVRNA